VRAARLRHKVARNQHAGWGNDIGFLPFPVEKLSRATSSRVSAFAADRRPERMRPFGIGIETVPLSDFAGLPFMNRYDELLELAHTCARNARSATSKEGATELWSMASEYRAKAAELGEPPNIGDPPTLEGRPHS
jgi:hypothetical protein